MESDLNFAHSKMSYTGGNSSPSRRKEKEPRGNAKIKVCVRIRPMLGHELNQGHS